MKIFNPKFFYFGFFGYIRLEIKNNNMVVQINVEVKNPEMVKIINSFSKKGGIFTNFNAGVLQDPLMSQYLELIFNEKVNFVDKPGYDNETESGIKIEHKGIIESSGLQIKNVGSKEEADYFSIFYASLNRLYVIEKKYINMMERCKDITNNKESINFNLGLDTFFSENRNSDSFKNSEILLKYSSIIDIEHNEVIINRYKGEDWEEYVIDPEEYYTTQNDDLYTTISLNNTVIDIKL